MAKRKIILVVVIIAGSILFGCNSLNNHIDNVMNQYKAQEINLPAYTKCKDLIIWKNALYYIHVDDYINSNDITDNCVYSISLTDLDTKANLNASDIKTVFSSNQYTTNIKFVEKKGALYFNTLRNNDLNTFKITDEIGNKGILMNRPFIDFDFWGDCLIVSSRLQMEVNNNLYLFKAYSGQHNNYNSIEAENISWDPNLYYENLYVLDDSLYTSARYRYSSSEGPAGYRHLYKFDLNTKKHFQFNEYPLKQFAIDSEHKKIYFLSEEQDEPNSCGYIYRMDLDGANLEKLSQIKFSSFSLAVDENKKTLELYCFACEDNKYKLYKIEPDTNEANLLLTLNSPFDEKQFIVSDGYIALTLVNQLGFIILNKDGQMLYSTNDPVIRATFNGHTAIYTTYNKPEDSAQIFKVDLLPQ